MSDLSRADALIARYAAGERSFADLELDDQVYCFVGAQLAGADFSRSFLLGDFRGANLAGAKFENANVKTCDFRGANLKGASFAGAAIDEAEFSVDTLIGVSFAGATEQGHIHAENELPVRDAV
ncbi:MAG TPA: pentapeptide repeat-containing protein [Terrimicrobiaceae bacterium]|nr:pentapeptide repeat-containing protein [Terrimicrobiaceae bacterium]